MGGATDLAAFSIGDRHFLAFACWRKGYSASDYELNSEIWEWDASSSDFKMIQLIPTSGAVAVTASSFGQQGFLVFAHYCGSYSCTGNHVWTLGSTEQVFVKLAEVPDPADP